MKQLLTRVSRWEAVFFVLALVSVVPLWIVRHPPLQDLPQHLAAMRVLHDFRDPALHFADYFQRSLASTQYLAYYLLVDLLAYPFGVVYANKLVLSACLIATPYALRSLLDAIGRDSAYGLLVLPLTYNAHLILGFFNFVAAIPLMLWGLALAVRQRRSATPRRALLLALVMLVTFYTHVLPCALLLVGALLVLARRDLRAMARALWPLAPTLLAGLVWSRTTPAGRAVLAATGAEQAGLEPRFEPWDQALRQLPDWLTDVLHTPADEQLLVAFLLLLLAALLLGSIVPKLRRTEPLDVWLESCLAALCLAAALGYFVAPSSYDWIWPINARFALLSLVLLLPLLPPLIEPARRVVLLAAAVIALTQFWYVARAFHEFERRELAGFERVSAVIPPGSRVVGLIWDRGSRYVKFSPLLHAAAMHQAERGGAAMFSFADFAQSPIAFLPHNRPPRVPPRWEWLPQQVDPDRQLGWFDYVLVRGGPGRLERSRNWQLARRDGSWAVYRRAGKPAQPPM